MSVVVSRSYRFVSFQLIFFVIFFFSYGRGRECAMLNCCTDIT